MIKTFDIEHCSYTIDENGTVVSLQRDKTIKQREEAGYMRVSLVNGSHYVHRLVAQAFIPNPENKPCVNHKDGNKKNNNVYNLEWCTHKENSKHAYDMGLLTTPDPNKKLETIHIEGLVALRKLGWSQYKLAEFFGISQARVSKILS